MISSVDFLSLQKLLLERSGMALTSDKLYLVASRLAPVAQKLGLKSVIELMAALRERPREEMINAVIEAMVTHESLFFRDERPFEHLTHVVIPDILSHRLGMRPIRIWSAACSSGQEAYSIAMLIHERFPGMQFEILGTDISAPIVAKARAGVYSAFEVKRGLTPERLGRFFRIVDAQTYAISDTLRRMVRFETHNLLQSALRFGFFDVVFCRNVLIYFDAPTKMRVLELIARQMDPDGWLFLGSADTVVGVTDKFVGAGQERGVYRPAFSTSKVA
ncbi:MAG: protein-glutamate O-methyltransferase CheR [Hyphomonadaceae bacterium]|nr:protein-glutamate O-methyltransferase CheR [Hyphomonadaceae bacterium]